MSEPSEFYGPVEVCNTIFKQFQQIPEIFMGKSVIEKQQVLHEVEEDQEQEKDLLQWYVYGALQGVEEAQHRIDAMDTHIKINYWQKIHKARADE